MRARKPRKNASATRRQPGEPNPTIPCACQCGGTLQKFSADGRPRELIRGHAKPASNAARLAVLAELRAGEERPKQIAEKLGRTVNAVSIDLTHLRVAGLAAPRVRGRWMAVEPGQAAEGATSST